MALVIPPGFALASWHFVSDSGTPPYVTTCGTTLADEPGSEVELADALFNAYATNILPATSSVLALDHVTVQTPAGGGLLASFTSTETSSQGGDSGAPSPLGAAIVLKKVTAVGGRAGRGRMFLPGTVMESQVDANGFVNPAQLTAVRDAMVDLWADVAIAAPGATPVLLHDEASPVTAPSTITAWVAAPIIGWIRKRIR